MCYPQLSILDHLSCLLKYHREFWCLRIHYSICWSFPFQWPQSISRILLYLSPCFLRCFFPASCLWLIEERFNFSKDKMNLSFAHNVRPASNWNYKQYLAEIFAKHYYFPYKWHFTAVWIGESDNVLHCFVKSFKIIFVHYRCFIPNYRYGSNSKLCKMTSLFDVAH